jgi:hypothetical protein
VPRAAMFRVVMCTLHYRHDVVVLLLFAASVCVVVTLIKACPGPHYTAEVLLYMCNPYSFCLSSSCLVPTPSIFSFCRGIPFLAHLKYLPPST